MRHLAYAMLAIGLLGSLMSAPVIAQSAQNKSHYDEYSWTKSSMPPGSYTLWRGGLWVGSYDPLTGQYRPRVIGTSELGSPAACPTEVPVKNFGINARRLGTTSRYSIRGEEVKRERVLEKLQQAREIKDMEFPNVPDHSQSLRVVVIGADRAERDRILAEIQNDLLKRGSAQKAICDDYDASHWAVSGQGYVSNGRPTVYILGSSGKVLHRQDDPSEVTKALGVALREPNPRYDPNQDPDLRKSQPWSPFGPARPTPGGTSPVLWMLAFGGFALVLVLVLKK